MHKNTKMLRGISIQDPDKWCGASGLHFTIKNETNVIAHLKNQSPESDSSFFFTSKSWASCADKQADKAHGKINII